VFGDIHHRFLLCWAEGVFYPLVFSWRDVKEVAPPITRFCHLHLLSEFLGYILCILKHGEKVGVSVFVVTGVTPQGSVLG
jgi:hypothetical protein